MKCHQAQDLIYLYRPGELTGERRRALEEHLTSCPTCDAEMKAVLEMEKKLSEVRNIEPRLEDAAHLTRAIMGAITTSRHRQASILGTFPEWTASPAYRVAACVALFVISGAFFLQTAIDAREMATLELRLKSVRTIPGTIGPLDIQRAGVFLPGLEGIAALPVSPGITLARIDHWQKDPAVSGILQTLFGKQGQNGTSLIDHLAKKHPRLASVRIDDGFDDREREILNSDGEVFIKEIETLIRKGGINHER